MRSSERENVVAGGGGIARREKVSGGDEKGRAG